MSGPFFPSAQVTLTDVLPPWNESSPHEIWKLSATKIDPSARVNSSRLLPTVSLGAALLLPPHAAAASAHTVRTAGRRICHLRSGKEPGRRSRSHHRDGGCERRGRRPLP